MRKKSPDVETLYDLYRGPGRCWWCRRLVTARQPHHVVTRGAGGPDIPENLVALCATFAGGHHCHDLVHSSDRRRPSRLDLLDLVAQRLGKEKHEVLAAIYAAMNRKTKGGEP